MAAVNPKHPNSVSQPKPVPYYTGINICSRLYKNADIVGLIGLGACLGLGYIYKSFVFLTQYRAGDKIKKNEMGWACGAYG